MSLLSICLQALNDAARARKDLQGCVLTLAAQMSNPAYRISESN